MAMDAHDPSSNIITGDSLMSQGAEMFGNIKDKIGTGQVTSSAIAFAPTWIVKNSMQADHYDN